MEPMDIFYQILHEDLNPLTTPKEKAYNNPLNKISDDKKTRVAKNIPEITEEQFLFYETLLCDTLKKVKRDLHEKVFHSFQDAAGIASIIQNYQILILTYCNIIEQQYLEGEEHTKYQISQERSIIDVFKLTYQTLDAIANYLEVSFFKYLNHSQEIPYQRKLWYVHQQKETCILLIDHIQSLTINRTLQEIICAPLLKVSKNDLSGFTYQEREYYTVYIKVLTKLLFKNTVTVETIYAVLISLEFNTFKIFFFLTDTISGKVKRLQNPKKKIARLHQFLKEVKTTTVTTPTKYNPNLPSLKEQLLIWTQEEIRSLQRNIPYIPSVSHEKSRPKKLLTITVSEISLITRLLYEQNLLEGSKKLFFEFLSETYQTRKAKIISPESISNRYYSVTEVTKNSVKRLLRKMLVHIDKMEA